MWIRTHHSKGVFTEKGQKKDPHGSLVKGLSYPYRDFITIIAENNISVAQ